MSRPERGSPEWDLWIAAIDVAIAAPDAMRKATTQIPVRRVQALRDALDGVGIDWRRAKHTDEVTT